MSHLALTFASAISVQLNENMAQYPIHLRRRIKINPNPIFPVIETETGSSNSKSQTTILYVGRITFQKNLEVLVNAVSKLASQP
jgi:glycosyltransferase involved in cell wall biosynthesis